MSSILPIILVALVSIFVILFTRFKNANKKRNRAYETWSKFYGYGWIKNTNKSDIDVIKSYNLVYFRFNGKKYIAKKEEFDGSDMVKTIEGVHIKKEEIPEREIISHNRISQGILKGDIDKNRILVLMKVNTEGISDTGLITTYPVAVTDGYEDDRLTQLYFLSTFPYATWQVSQVATFEREQIDDLFKDWDNIEKSEAGDGE